MARSAREQELLSAVGKIVKDLPGIGHVSRCGRNTSGRCEVCDIVDRIHGRADEAIGDFRRAELVEAIGK
jgi:hypothetical protein